MSRASDGAHGAAPSGTLLTLPSMSTDVREAIAVNLRSCIRRGVVLPRRPDAIDLYDACGGDGYLALLVMLEFIAAERTVVDECGARDERERRERRELADSLAA